MTLAEQGEPRITRAGYAPRRQPRVSLRYLEQRDRSTSATGCCTTVIKALSAASVVTALSFFIIQLIADATRSWLFFGWQLPLAALLELVILWLLVLGAQVLFWWIWPLASIPLLPYLA